MIQDDNQLIKKAQNGDTTAFRELLYRYDRQVLNIAASYRNSEEDAKDIYQEVFLRVHKGLKNFQFRSEFSTWLFRITTNVCISINDKKKRRRMESIDREIVNGEGSSVRVSDLIEGSGSADDELLTSEISQRINNALETLPGQQKMAFTLKYYEDYKIKEIADMMNCAEGTIKRYLFTATNKLKDQLKDLV